MFGFLEGVLRFHLVGFMTFMLVSWFWGFVCLSLSPFCLLFGLGDLIPSLCLLAGFGVLIGWVYDPFVC